ncbi:hypothetical protein CWI36_0571p0010 [Hamiltosporidium magnivora]|uniref:Uncharacterized protein n=1 Tax=Hamiltosporidium magnivora TaxID=148818 RepID=A0A4Q9LD53_9MICR|nr:hypothetical protein CWI36_0571p0010 [Hamiltosporidium magnivora]
MSDSFSGKNTHEKKYHFYVDETPECIECENDLLVLEKYLPVRRNSPSQIEFRTNYATSFRELEVDNDDKNFVFLDEFGGCGSNTPQ